MLKKVEAQSYASSASVRTQQPRADRVFCAQAQVFARNFHGAEFLARASFACLGNVTPIIELVSARSIILIIKWHISPGLQRDATEAAYRVLIGDYRGAREKGGNARVSRQQMMTLRGTLKWIRE
jgi:hypothetical protein